MSSIKRNFAYNIIYQILIIIIPLITTPYLSRILGATGLGEYSFSFSVADYFALIAMLGIKNYGNRTIASCAGDKNRISKEFWSIYFVQLSSSIVVLGAYTVYILFFATRAVSVAKVAIIYEIATIFDISWFFFGLEKFKITVTRSIIVKLISTILIFALVRNQNDVWLYMFIMTGSVLISNLILWKYVRTYVNVVEISKEKVISHIKPILILFIPAIAISFYHVMDKIMLGILSNMEQVGYYENSEKIITLPYSVITALGTVMLPRMSNLISNGKLDEGKKYISYSIEFVFFLGVALTFGIAAVSPHLVPVFLGDDFLPCVNLLVLLSPLVIIKAWANVIRTQYLLPSQKDKQYVESVIFGAIANLIINYSLIPSLGAYGAVIGTLVAEFCVGCYQTLSVRKELPVGKYFTNNLWFVLIGFVMFAVVRICVNRLQPTVTSLLIEVVAGAIIYVVLSMVMLVIKKDSVLLLEIKKIIKRH
jgi:O-antigen/teichoic acid export membrane protein